jgi:DNA ligase (NAD+)
MPLSVFRTHFALNFANPRNLTAGALKQKDPAKTADYKIRFLAYDLEPTAAFPLTTELEKRRILVTLGFTPVEQIEVDSDTAVAAYASIMAQRDAYDFETDGVVFKANLVEEHERLGFTAHHPRYALAYKFQGDSGASRLVGVEWSVSRTGAVNPIGVVEPVMLSGVTVTRASLHNLSIMEKLGGETGLRLGSRVLMMRRGGVIPHVEQIIEPGQQEIVIPASCPSCGGATVRREDTLFADHLPTCSATKLGELSHFVNVIGAKGFGPKLLIQLVEDEVVTEPADFYKLTVDALVQLERVGRKLAEKLVGEIDERRALPLDRFLCALGIDELGPHVAGLLAGQYGQLAAIRAAQVDELRPFAAWTHHCPTRSTAWRARRRYRPFARARPLDRAQRRFATGCRRASERKEPLHRRAGQQTHRGQERALWGETPSSASRTLTYLVLGDADLDRFRGGWRSSKLKKVDELNQNGAAIAVIGESDFVKFLEPSP